TTSVVSTTTPTVSPGSAGSRNRLFLDGNSGKLDPCRLQVMVEGAHADPAAFGIQTAVELPVAFSRIIGRMFTAHPVKVGSAGLPQLCQRKSYIPPLGISSRNIPTGSLKGFHGFIKKRQIVLR